MDNLAATPLNLLTATDVHTRREPTDGSAGDISAFEELLGNEIALIAPDVTGQAAELLETDLSALAADETATPADGTQILEAILDSASVLPAAGMPTLMPTLQTPDQPLDTHFTQARGLELTVAEPAATAAAPDVGGSDTNLLVEEHATLPADIAATAARPHAGQEPEVKLAPAAAAPAAAAVVGASAAVPEAPRLAGDQKNLTAAAKAAPGTAESPVATDRKESRAPAAAARLDEALPASSDTTKDRGRTIEPMVTAGAAEARLATDSSAQLAPASSSLDALSSAALVSKWTPGATSSASTAPSAATSARIDQPLGTEAWSDAFRQKVVWLVDRQQQSAELHVNPPHLGPVEVMLSLGDDGARIVFCSPHPVVREAIETSLADLRSALAQHGLALGEALVSADPGTAREQLREQAMRNTAGGAAKGADAGTVSEIQTVPRMHRGLVDTFA